MATANDLITKSLRLISVLGSGRRTATANELDDGLASLNSMLDGFSIERLMIYQILEETHTLVVGTADYTIGSGGDIDTTRPVKIENIFLRDDADNDYLLHQIDNLPFDSIPLKTVTSRPRVFYYDAQFPLGVIKLMYPPAYADTMHVNSWKQLQSFANGTTALAMPPGYQRMIEFNLALELHGEYPGSILTDDVRRVANQSKANLKKLNSKLPISDMSDVVMESRNIRTQNIFTG